MTREAGIVLIVIGVSILAALAVGGTSDALVLMAGCCFGFALRDRVG